MTPRAFGQVAFRRSLVVITCLALISGSAPGLYAQSSAAAITGVILDPEGKPASGFKVVFRDVGSGTNFTSGPTDASGNYSLNVPLGGRYKIDGVLADDGVTKLPVQEIPPISVLTPGTTRLNVRFANAPTPAAAAAAAPAAGAAAAAAAAAAPAPKTAPASTAASTAASTPPPKSSAPAPAPAEKKKDKSAAPWYKRPGPITGMVIGGVLLVGLAVAGGGGGDDNVASQSSP